MREIALSTPGIISDSLTPYTPLDRGKIYDIVYSRICEMLSNLAEPDSYIRAQQALQTKGAIADFTPNEDEAE